MLVVLTSFFLGFRFFVGGLDGTDAYEAELIELHKSAKHGLWFLCVNPKFDIIQILHSGFNILNLTINEFIRFIQIFALFLNSIPKSLTHLAPFLIVL